MKILELLEQAHVFSIARAVDDDLRVVAGKWAVTEECDRYYSKELTKDQIRQLANEIWELAEK